MRVCGRFCCVCFWVVLLASDRFKLIFRATRATSGQHDEHLSCLPLPAAPCDALETHDPGEDFWPSHSALLQHGGGGLGGGADAIAEAPKGRDGCAVG